MDLTITSGFLHNKHNHLCISTLRANAANTAMCSHVACLTREAEWFTFQPITVTTVVSTQAKNFPTPLTMKPKTKQLSQRPKHNHNHHQKQSFLAPGDIAYIYNLGPPRTHLNGSAVKIIGEYNAQSARYPIELISNPQQKGLVHRTNLRRKSPEQMNQSTNQTKITNTLKAIQQGGGRPIQSKPRQNCARFFSSKLMRTQQNYTNSTLLNDIKLFQTNCIYIPRYYNHSRSQSLFNTLQRELNEKLQSEELKMDDDDQCQMVCNELKYLMKATT